MKQRRGYRGLFDYGVRRLRESRRREVKPGEWGVAVVIWVSRRNAEAWFLPNEVGRGAPVEMCLLHRISFASCDDVPVTTRMSIKFSGQRGCGTYNERKKG